MLNLKSLACAGAILAASALAGCTSQDEQAAIAAIQATCAIGGAIGVTVATNGVIVADISTASATCGAVISAVQTAVSAITASGGTAVVTVNQPATASRKAKRGIYKVAPGGQVFVIRPIGIPGLFGF